MNLETNDNRQEYDEVFVNLTLPYDFTIVQKELERVCREHPSTLGWIGSEPVVTANKDKESIVLEICFKRPKEKEMGHSK